MLRFMTWEYDPLPLHHYNMILCEMWWYHDVLSSDNAIAHDGIITHIHIQYSPDYTTQMELKAGQIMKMSDNAEN
jgi:hypothetical protein